MMKHHPSYLLAALIMGGAIYTASAQVEAPADVNNNAMAEEEPSTVGGAGLYDPAGDEAEANAADSETELESEEVEYSITELQQLIQSGGTAPSKEYQEDPSNPKVLFSSESELQSIFDETPSFIYFPTGPDPMIIPWVRERVIAEELFSEAMVAKTARDFDKARAILQEISDKYPETEHGVKAPGELAAIDQQLENERLAALEAELAQGQATQEALPLIAGPQEPEDPVLPLWIVENTKAILMTESSEPVALVGTEFLRPGDIVPKFSAVRVKRVAPSQVVYTYQNEDFTVDVVGAF